MQRSAELRNALLRFHEVFSTEDLEGFTRILAQEEAEGVLAIGTDLGEWVEGRERWVAARKAVMRDMKGLRLERSRVAIRKARWVGSPTGQGLCCQTEAPSRRA